MPSSSSPTSESGSRSSPWSCTPTRRGSSSSGAMPPEHVQPVASGSPRPSTSLASRTSAGRARTERFWLRRKTISKRMRAKLARGQRPAQAPPASAHPRTGKVARPAWCEDTSPTTPCLATPTQSTAFRNQVTRLWFKALRRRSQRNRLNWDTDESPTPSDGYRPPASMHPFPIVRFDVRTQGRSPVR